MTWADNVNGIYECGGAIALAVNCYQTYKDKEIKGLNLGSMLFFTSWGYWNLYFYPSLNQWMSTIGAAALVFFNTIWCCQAIYYTKRKKGALKRFNQALAKFWSAACGTEKMVEDFEKHFPGKCVICSYQRYGYANGMTNDPNPPPHAHCPERDQHV
jgi:hypothetical protein